MDSHKKLLSILHIIYGSFFIVVYIVFNTIVRAILPFGLEEINQNDPDAAAIAEIAFSVIGGIIFILMVLVPIPSVIGGIAYLNNKKWGLTLMMISGCLSLLSVPLGTALGVYTIFTYLEVNKKDKNDEN